MSGAWRLSFRLFLGCFGGRDFAQKISIKCISAFGKSCWRSLLLKAVFLCPSFKGNQIVRDFSFVPISGKNNMFVDSNTGNIIQIWASYSYATKKKRWLKFLIMIIWEHLKSWTVDEWQLWCMATSFNVHII